MKSIVEKVEEFSRAFEAEVVPIEHWPSLAPLCRSAIAEELAELESAMKQTWAARMLNHRVTQYAGMHDTIDALGDIVYVTLDMAYRLGCLHLLPEAMEQIHKSNMSKLGEDRKPLKREDGKIMKGPDFTPPEFHDISAIDGEGNIIFAPR